jgi:hypothetical protein
MLLENMVSGACRTCVSVNCFPPSESKFHACVSVPDLAVVIYSFQKSYRS